MNKLFIGSLAYATTNDSLRAHFEQIGPVEEAKVVMMPDNPERSKGFGFVTYKEEADAKTAVEKLDNSELDGRNIHVNEARPREDRPRGNFDRGGNGGGSFRQRSW